jgi:hypothetical protein
MNSILCIGDWEAAKKDHRGMLSTVGDLTKTDMEMMELGSSLSNQEILLRLIECPFVDEDGWW